MFTAAIYRAKRSRKTNTLEICDIQIISIITLEVL